MRFGMAGLSALYWPICMGGGLKNKTGAAFTAATAMGEDDGFIKDCLGMTAGEYAGKFGVKLYGGVEEMIEAERLDAVVINARHSEHADLAERIAKRGVNIFIPKTFATTAEDADRIVEAGRENGVQILSGPSAASLPEMVTLKQALDNGMIGRVFSVRVCHNHGTIDVFHPNDWYRLPEEGGPELSLAWYGVDLIMYLTGEDVTKVNAFYGNFNSPGSPFMDCGRLSLTMESGALAAFDMYFCNRAAYPSWQAEIVGTDGVLSLCRTEGDAYKTSVCADLKDGHKTIPVLDNAPPWELAWADDLMAGRPHFLTAERAARITKISIAARESAKNDTAVRV